MNLLDCKSMTLEELRELLVSRNIPAFRAVQLKTWLDNGITDFDEMSNLPLPLRQEFENIFTIPTVKIEKKLVSARDNTVKYLYGLSDGENIESVLMQYRHGWSQCLSTQVGCKMGCSFCATGMSGFVRNLLPSEMMAEIEKAQEDRQIRVSSIVFMGMGEPLDNFDNVLRFIHMLSEPGGVQIGMRHISLSTCGLVDKIYELMKYKLQITLSVSLHAPNDQIRSRMMPVNRKWPIEELMEACRKYIEATGRRISFEYAMVSGVNDSDACAMELSRRLKGMLCHVNLIPINEIPGKDQQRSSMKRLQAFTSILEKTGITVTTRRTLGSDINASCGQLRRQKLESD